MPPTVPVGTNAFDPSLPWTLHPQVSLRPEAFGALAYHFGTRRLSFLKSPTLLAVVSSLATSPTGRDACTAAGVALDELPTYERALATLAESGMICERVGVVTLATAERPAPLRLVDQFQLGLDAPICLTWELTYACNLACVHCLSSSGRRDPDELSTAECKRLIDEFERMQIFYVNIGGGEPTIRSDFWELVDYATDHHVGVKFSTNGSRITPEVAERLAASDYVDVQISLDGATPEVNDAVRGAGSFATAVRAMERMAAAGFVGFKLSVVVTRQNVSQLDAFQALADRYRAQLRLTRLRPSGRGADVWDELHPTAEQQSALYEWLLAHGEQVLTGDSFFHLAGYGESLPGLNLCGAGRVVCLVDPVGDVYACPFAIHDEFRAGNVRSLGGFDRVWKSSALFGDLRRPDTGGACASCGSYDACRGGCMAAKFFTGLPLDGPDPECVLGNGEPRLAAVDGTRLPQPSPDHSRRSRTSAPVAVALLPRRPERACDEHPLAAVDAGHHPH